MGSLDHRAMSRATAENPEVGTTLARAAVYRLLGGAFAYPTPAAMEEIGGLAGVVAAGPLSVPSLRESALALEAAARTADAGALAEEYVFLFDRQVRCPPYEGAYGDAPQLAGRGAQLADVAGFYAAFGLAPGAARPECEDHIAAELEFMSALALKEAYLLAEGEEEGVEVTRHAQGTFLTDHLGRWAETLAETLQASAALPYYRALAELLTAWVREDLSRFGVTPVRVHQRQGPDPVQEDRFACPMAPAGQADEGGHSA
jgi:TorA maturation chaperone TorD